MDKFHNHRHEFPRIIPAGEPVDFIFDEMMAEKKVVSEFWDDYMQGRPPAVRDLYGAQPLFRNDNQDLPLQAADMLAGQLRDHYLKGEPIGVDFETDPNILPLLAIEFDEDALAKAFCAIVGASLPNRMVIDARWGEIDL
ncbi:MAG: hypothetical protein QNL92_00505 [Octadecabacter sp.]